MIEIEGGPGGVRRDSLRELWAYREVLWAFLVRHVKVRYKQAFLGVGWAVLQPVAAAAIFAVFLGHVARVTGEGAPYLLFALTGMVAWTFFTGAATPASEVIVANSSLLRKVYFPREVLPLAAVGAALVDLVPGLATLLIASLLYGVVPSWEWIFLPVPIAILVLFSCAIGFVLSALNAYYRDVRYALPFLIQLGLFASPVVYSLQAVPGRWRGPYAVVNPVAAAIDGLRRIVLHHQSPQAMVTVAAIVWSLVLTIGGYAFFKRVERGFADRV